jgi:hypothetical protein
VETVPDQNDIEDANDTQPTGEAAMEDSPAVDGSENASISTEENISRRDVVDVHADFRNRMTAETDRDVEENTPTKVGQAPPRTGDTVSAGGHGQPRIPLPSPMIMAE